MLRTMRRVLVRNGVRRLSSAITDSDLVSYLRHPSRDSEVFLVGTVHISSRSSRLVRDVIASVKPEVVMVELCEARHRKVTAMARGEQETVFDSILRTAGLSKAVATQYVGEGLVKSIDTYFRGNEMLAGCVSVMTSSMSSYIIPNNHVVMLYISALQSCHAIYLLPCNHVMLHLYKHAYTRGFVCAQTSSGGGFEGESAPRRPRCLSDDEQIEGGCITNVAYGCDASSSGTHSVSVDVKATLSSDLTSR